MRIKQNHIGLFILTGILLCISVVGPKMIAFAGGINEHEAGVIAAASGTFDYNGKTYRAGSAYINSLTSYLAEDDVDLTAEQAREAISTMYANVAQGVEQGYLYEVGGENETSATTEEDWADADNGDDDEKTTTEASSGNEDATVWDAMSKQTEAKKKLENRPDKQDASASVKLGEDDIIITTKDNEQISISKKEQLIPDKVLIIVDGISIVILAVNVVSGVILFATKCMTFKRRKGRRARPGHSKRRKIRRYTRNVLTVTTTVSLIGCFVLLGSYISLFNKNAIMQNMQSSGYFRYAYSEYITGMADELRSKYTEGGADFSESDTIVTYEDYLFTIKQNSLKILNGETNIRIPDSNVTPYIYNMKNSYMKLFRVAGICILINTLLGSILIIFMDQRRERGIKHLAAAELIASVFMIVATIVMIGTKPYLHLYIEPDYLYLFLMECIRWSVKVMVSITAFGVVFGMILIGVYKTVLNSHSEN